MIQFDCVDCGWRVSLFREAPPDHGRCSECVWIAEHVAPEDQPAARIRLALMRCGDAALWQYDGIA